MATLYELTDIFRQIYEADVDDNVKADTLESMDWQEDFTNKVDGYIRVIKNLEADIVVRKQEMDRMAELNDTDKKKIDHLKKVLKEAMEMTNNTKVDTGLFKASVWTPKASVIVDEETLEDKFFVTKTTKTPDKKTLYELLKQGEEVKGATLQTNTALKIK